MKKVGEENFSLFNKTNINGEIAWVGIKNKGSGFRLKNDTITYVFNSNFSLNGSHNFTSFAKPGDFIYKAPFSDTLKVIKSESGKAYFFTFNKLTGN